MRKSKKSRSAIVLMSVALSVQAGSASAVLIDGMGNDVINYSFSSVQNGVTLSGSVNVDVTAFTSNQIRLFVTLTNTTPTGTAGNNRWTHWGFGSSPDIQSIGFSDTTDGGMTNASRTNFPALSLIEACSTAATNCAGGGNGGIGEDSFDSFTLVLNYASIPSAGVELSPFGVKFQAVGPPPGPSAEFYTCVTNCAPPPPPPPGACEPTAPGCTDQTVPEPGSLALLGLGLAGLAASRRRKQ